MNELKRLGYSEFATEVRLVVTMPDGDEAIRIADIAAWRKGQTLSDARFEEVKTVKRGSKGVNRILRKLKRIDPRNAIRVGQVLRQMNKDVALYRRGGTIQRNGQQLDSGTTMTWSIYTHKDGKLKKAGVSFPIIPGDEDRIERIIDTFNQPYGLLIGKSLMKVFDLDDYEFWAESGIAGKNGLDAFCPLFIFLLDWADSKGLLSNELVARKDFQEKYSKLKNGEIDFSEFVHSALDGTLLTSYFKEEARQFVLDYTELDGYSEDLAKFFGVNIWEIPSSLEASKSFCNVIENSFSNYKENLKKNPEIVSFSQDLFGEFKEDIVMRMDITASDPRLNSILAVIGITLLLPAVYYFLTYSISNYLFYISILGADPSEKSYIVDKAASVVFSKQMYSLLTLIPGLFICSFIVFVKGYGSIFFARSLLGLSAIMFLTAPLITIAGCFLYFVFRKIEKKE